MYNQILYPVDGSTECHKMLEHVVAHAKAFGAKVSVLNVYHLPLSMPQVHVHTFPPEVQQQISAGAEKESQELLREVRRELYSRGVDCQTFSIHGNPKWVIPDFARENKCDLILMSTRGAGALQLNGSINHFGSTCSHVVHHTPGIPVMVVDLN